MTKMFERTDKDGNGWVTHEQAVDLVKAHFKKFPEESLKKMVKRFDKGGDDKIHYKEFVFFYCNFLAR